ncbi:MAG: NHL repeat-containing protein [Sedimentisphaerales bacterium]
MLYRLARYPSGCPGTPMTFFTGKRKAGFVGLSLVLGLATAVLAAPQVSDPKSDVRTIKSLGKRVLVGPEASPFNMPSDAAVGHDGVLYVLDGVNHRVAAYDVNGEFRFQFGSRGSKRGQLLFPLGIATAPDGKVYVADSGNHRFQIFAEDGKPIDAVTLPPGASGVLPDPFPFLLDVSPQGYVFVVEPINTRVQVLNPEGKFVGFVGGWGVKPGQLFRPKGVAICADRVFVTDSYLGNVQVFDERGDFLGLLADAAGKPLKLVTPTGITSDPERKRLYVVELKANRVCCVDLE